MFKNKKLREKILLTIAFLLFLVSIAEIGYYFFLKSPPENDKSNEVKPIVPWQVVDVLKVPGFSFNEKPNQNIKKIEGGGLIIDNTFGRVKNAYYSYNDRSDIFSVGNKLEADLAFYKRTGKETSIKLIATLPEDENDWWSTIRDIEVSILEDDNLYLKFIDTSKDINEIFFIGKMPFDGKITLKIEGNKASFYDSQNSLLGEEISLKENPFHQEVSFGFSVGPKSILEISQFSIRLSKKEQTQN